MDTVAHGRSAAQKTNSPPAVLFPHHGNGVRSDRTEEDLHIETYIKAEGREDDEH